MALYEGDVAMLLQRYRPAMNALLDELTRYLADADIQAVRQIVLEAEQRIERFWRSQRR